MSPWGKDFHPLQSETRTSCLICYDHYESCRDCQGAGALAQGPPALLPGQPFLLLVLQSLRILRGCWSGEKAPELQTATLTIRAQSTCSFPVCNALGNTLIAAHGA